jgi:hypothetical protein
MTTDLSPLSGELTAAQVRASADAHAEAAEFASIHAAGWRAEAEGALEAARAEAAKIIADAEARARPLGEDAARADGEAAAKAELARLIGAAAGHMEAADAAEQHAAALRAEREAKAAIIAGLDERLGELAAERRDLATRMDAARESGDLGELAALRARDSAAAEVTEALERQKAAPLARISEIGDGTENHASHPLLKTIPPLSQAVRAAEWSRWEARKTLNRAWPERSEAAADERAAALRGWLEGLGESAVEAPKPRPRAQVYLS